MEFINGSNKDHLTLLVSSYSS